MKHWYSSILFLIFIYNHHCFSLLYEPQEFGRELANHTTMLRPGYAESSENKSSTSKQFPIKPVLAPSIPKILTTLSNIGAVCGAAYLIGRLIKEWWQESQEIAQPRPALSTHQEKTVHRSQTNFQPPTLPPAPVAITPPAVSTVLLPADELRHFFQEYTNRPEEYSFLGCENLQRRVQALENPSDEVMVQQYCLSEQVKNTLSYYKLQFLHYEKCVGTAIQQIVHQECIAVVDQAKKVAERELHKLVVKCADSSREYNGLNKIGKALCLLDICWSVIKCVQKGDLYLGIFVGMAMVDGAVKASCNMVDTCARFVCSPLCTTQEWGESFCTVVKSIWNFFAHYQSGTANQLLSCALSHAAENPYDTIKEFSCASTELFLTHKITGGLSRIARSAWAHVPEYTEKVKKIAHTLRTSTQSFPTISKPALVGVQEPLIHAVAETTPLIIKPYEMFIEKGTENLLRSVQEAEKIIEILPATQKTLDALKRLLHEIEQDIQRLARLFANTRKGFAECADKYIKPDYKHFLGIDLKIRGDKLVRWSGFHHDYMGVIEKSGLVEFLDKIPLKNGFYEAKVVIDGIADYKTFFPQHWPREKVMSTIFEAYDNFIQNGKKGITLTRSGNYKIDGLSSEGVKIVMLIKKLSGDLPTAYPVFT